MIHLRADQFLYVSEIDLPPAQARDVFLAQMGSVDRMEVREACHLLQAEPVINEFEQSTASFGVPGIGATAMATGQSAIGASGRVRVAQPVDNPASNHVRVPTLVVQRVVNGEELEDARCAVLFETDALPAHQGARRLLMLTELDKLVNCQLFLPKKLSDLLAKVLRSGTDESVAFPIRNREGNLGRRNHKAPFQGSFSDRGASGENPPVHEETTYSLINVHQGIYRSVVSPDAHMAVHPPLASHPVGEMETGMNYSIR